MMRVIVVLLIAVIGISAAWRVDNYKARVKTQDEVIANLQDASKRDHETLQAERDWAKSRENVIGELLKIGKDMQTMREEVDLQNREQAKTLQELVKNDKAIQKYMAATVPAKLGVQYERPATTDPTQYGPSGSVRSNPVPAAGKASTKGK